MNYALQSIDEEDTPDELKKKFEQKVTGGYAEEIVESGEDVKFDVSDGKASYAEIMGKTEDSKDPYINEGPMYLVAPIQF